MDHMHTEDVCTLNVYMSSGNVHVHKAGCPHLCASRRLLFNYRVYTCMYQSLLILTYMYMCACNSKYAVVGLLRNWSYKGGTISSLERTFNEEL